VSVLPDLSTLAAISSLSVVSTHRYRFAMSTMVAVRERCISFLRCLLFRLSLRRPLSVVCLLGQLDLRCLVCLLCHSVCPPMMWHVFTLFSLHRLLSQLFLLVCFVCGAECTASPVSSVFARLAKFPSSVLLCPESACTLPSLFLSALCAASVLFHPWCVLSVLHAQSVCYFCSGLFVCSLCSSYLPVCLSFCLSVCLAGCLSVCLFVCLSACLSVCVLAPTADGSANFSI